MAENSEAEIQVRVEKLRHELTLPVQSQFIRDDLKWALDLLASKAIDSQNDFIEGWNSALDAVDSVMSTWYDRQWLIDLRAPDSDEFKKALARKDDPFDERHGSGY